MDVRIDRSNSNVSCTSIPSKGASGISSRVDDAARVAMLSLESPSSVTPLPRLPSFAADRMVGASYLRQLSLVDIPRDGEIGARLSPTGRREMGAQDMVWGKIMDGHARAQNQSNIAQLSRDLQSIAARSEEDPFRRKLEVSELLSKCLAYSHFEPGDSLKIPWVDSSGKNINIEYAVDVYNIYHGMPAYILTPKDNQKGPPFVVFRGTDLSSFAAVVCDIDALKGETPGVRALAAKAESTKTMLAHLSTEFGESPIVCGHSLGGVLAAQTAFVFRESIGEVYTFNAPGFSQSDAMRFSDKPHAPLYQITLPEDVVGRFGHHLGHHLEVKPTSVGLKSSHSSTIFDKENLFIRDVTIQSNTQRVLATRRGKRAVTKKIAYPSKNNFLARIPYFLILISYWIQRGISKAAVAIGRMESGRSTSIRASSQFRKQGTTYGKALARAENWSDAQKILRDYAQHWWNLPGSNCQSEDRVTKEAIAGIERRCETQLLEMESEIASLSAP